MICAGSYAGIAMARRCGERLTSLRQFLSCTVFLRSYLNYTSVELSEGLVQCARGSNQKVNGFFSLVAATLKKDYLVTPEYAVEEGLKAYKDALALCKEDCEALRLLGANLGRLDKAEQEKCLLMVEKRLAVLEREAAVLRDRNSKMYCYLGICSSMMIVLLLV